MSESNSRVLVVDDEQAILRFLRVALESQAYTVFEAASGQEALSDAIAHKPDIIVLDLGLPDIDGVEVTRLLRQWTQIPIIILSVRGSERDKIAALDAGADDYLTKPFGVGELLARLRAALRRASQPKGEPVFTSDDLKVDLARRLVTVAGREVQFDFCAVRAAVTLSAGVWPRAPAKPPSGPHAARVAPHSPTE